jgi:prolyl 4-hydroxylase
VEPEHSLDESWQAWLQENLSRGCSPMELVDILKGHGFSLPAIRRHMGARFPESMDQRGASPLQLPPLMLRPPPQLHRIDTDAVELYTLEGFLRPGECTRLTNLIRHHLRASTVTIAGTERSFRTSLTCDLSLLRSRIATEIDRRISRILGIRLEYSEGIQAQCYEVGQQFRAHTDYFEPGTEEYARFAAERGNRTWTFMVYLNEGMEGGGTRFHAINQVFQPRQGMAVIWNNLNPDRTPNQSTLHSGEPVLAGRKVIITKWFREFGKGPMFHEP